MSDTGYLVWFIVTTLLVVAIIATGIIMALSSQRHSMHDPHPR